MKPAQGHNEDGIGPGRRWTWIPHCTKVWVWLWVFGWGCLGLVRGVALPSTGPVETIGSLEELRVRIAAHLAQPRFKGAFWGVHVQSLDTGQILFEHNADKRLRPASNAKLFTAALALDQLGPDHRIRTSILAVAPPDRSGALMGDLIIRGRGDFSMAGRFRGGDRDQALASVVDAIERAGVQQVRGDLIGDATWFHGPPYGAGWTWEDLDYSYGAGVSALNLDDNVIELRIRPGHHPGEHCRAVPGFPGDYLTVVNRTRTVGADSHTWLKWHRPPGGNVVHLAGQLAVHGGDRIAVVPVHDPALWFVTRLHEELARRGVRISGEARVVDWLRRPGEGTPTGSLIELGTVKSPPMHELIWQMMKPSQNLYAQALWLQVGAARLSGVDTLSGGDEGGDPLLRITTTESASSALREFLTGVGIPTDEVLIEEGSGLSRRTLITPRAIVGLLESMTHHRHAAVFCSSLPVAGVDGTLRARMRGTVAEGSVKAKTGMLANTFTLSGYVRTTGGEQLAFAVLLNNHDAISAEVARADLDTVAIFLAGFHRGDASDD